MLSESEREHVGIVSDIADSICRDLGINLYQPRNVTDPVNNPYVPSEDVFNLDRDRVLGSDLVIHIADYASTGSGEELDFALNALIPIVLIAHGESKVSRMVTGIPALKLMIRYNDLAELESQLREGLTEIRPVLAERKLAFSKFDKNIVGNKIRNLREDLRLTREQVAEKIDNLLSEERISKDRGKSGQRIQPHPHGIAVSCRSSQNNGGRVGRTRLGGARDQSCERFDDGECSRPLWN